MTQVEPLHRAALRPRGGLRFALALLAVWSARARQRRALLELDDRSLDDIGITRAELEREAGKPFWLG